MNATLWYADGTCTSDPVVIGDGVARLPLGEGRECPILIEIPLSEVTEIPERGR